MWSGKYVEMEGGFGNAHKCLVEKAAGDSASATAAGRRQICSGRAGAGRACPKRPTDAAAGDARAAALPCGRGILAAGEQEGEASRMTLPSEVFAAAALKHVFSLLLDARGVPLARLSPSPAADVQSDDGLLNTLPFFLAARRPLLFCPNLPNTTSLNQGPAVLSANRIYFCPPGMASK